MIQTLLTLWKRLRPQSEFDPELEQPHEDLFYRERAPYLKALAWAYFVTDIIAVLAMGVVYWSAAGKDPALLWLIVALTGGVTGLGLCLWFLSRKQYMTAMGLFFIQLLWVQAFAGIPARDVYAEVIMFILFVAPCVGFVPDRRLPHWFSLEIIAWFLVQLGMFYLPNIYLTGGITVTSYAAAVGTPFLAAAAGVVIYYLFRRLSILSKMIGTLSLLTLIVYLVISFSAGILTDRTVKADTLEGLLAVSQAAAMGRSPSSDASAAACAWGVEIYVSSPKPMLFTCGSAQALSTEQARAFEQAAQNGESTEAGGEASLIGLAPVAGTNWRVVARHSADEIHQHAKALARTIRFLVGMLVGLVWLALIVVAQVITKPINQLKDVAVQVRGGDLNARAKVEGTDEVGLLTGAFNRMTRQLRETLEDLEQRVAERTKDLAAVAEVGTATATILETDKLLQEVVDLTKEHFNLYHSHIYLLDEAGKNLVLASGAGEAGRQMKARGLSIPLNREQSLVARAARERKGVIVNNVTQTPDFLSNPLLPDTRSELAAPMIVGGKVIGVFDIQSDTVGRFTDSDINVQTTLASQVAATIQNVRSFEQAKARADLEMQVNAIGQKIQRATTVEDTLQTAIRELGLALGAPRVKASVGGNTRQNGGEGTSSN